MELDTSNKSEISLAIEILETLLDSGVDLKYLKNIGGPLLLKDIKQPGLNIIKIMEDNDLNQDLDIGSLINRLKNSYKQAKHSSLTNDDITRLEDLKIVGDKDSEKEIWEETIENFIKVLNILRNNEIDLKILGRNLQKKDNKIILLKDINQPGLNIMKIIEDNDLDSELEIRDLINRLKKYYKTVNHSNLTEEDITSLEDLGIVGDRNIDEEIWEETIQNYMDILIILRNNGIDIEDIARNLENKDYEKTSLKDLNQLGVCYITIDVKQNI